MAGTSDQHRPAARISEFRRTMRESGNAPPSDAPGAHPVETPGSRPDHASARSDAKSETSPLGQPAIAEGAKAEFVSQRRTLDETAKRYDIERLLGTGASGQVYAAMDQDLQRSIAIKVLVGAEAGDVGQFIEEARITALLQHPNVLPIYDIEVNKRGQTYFTMKKIEGGSLGSAIDRSTSEARADEIASINAIVSLFINVGYALSFAHFHGIVHQDIKPDNIMLGKFGETLLVDWGSAVRSKSSSRGIYGTPLYMSPEQARREYADFRSDIYCLGASLYHVLTLRLPTWDDDPKVFWEKKKRGAIDPLNGGERKRVSAPLLAIAVKAMAADPKHRYQSVDGMVEDLKRFQGGLAITALRDTVFDKLKRGYRRNKRAVLASAAALAVVVTLGVYLYGERLKEVATWGTPVMREDFADDSWKTSWRVIEGSFERRDGMLVGLGEDGSRLMYPRKVFGDVAVEYDGEILPGSHPCDLSLTWFRDIAETADPAHPKRIDEWNVQFGAYDGSYTAILREETGSTRHVAYSDLRPEVGRLYHVRVEIADATITLAVDGKQICRYVHTEPLTGGYLALYGYYPGKAFGHVRIYSRGVPQKIATTAVGDAFLQKGEFANAEEAFAKVVSSQPGTALAAEAAYKQGFCRFRSGHHDQAFEMWRGLETTRWGEMIELHRLEDLFQQGRHDEMLHGMEALFAGSRDTETRPRLGMQWCNDTYDLIERGDDATLAKYLAFHDRVISGERTTDRIAADALLELGRYQEILDRYPRQERAGALALVYQGHPELVLTRFPTQRPLVRWALWESGRTAELATYLGDVPESAMADGRIARGEFSDYLTGPGAKPMALFAAGKPEVVLATQPDDVFLRNQSLMFMDQTDRIPEADAAKDGMVLMELGRLDEARRLVEIGDGGGILPRMVMGLEAYIRGDKAMAWPLMAVPVKMEFQQPSVARAHFLLAPFLAELDGRADAMKAVRDHLAEHRFCFEQHPWFQIRYVLGEIDAKAFLEQPHRIFAPAQLTLCDALRLERAGERAGALEKYLAYQRIPKSMRSYVSDPFGERFVAWRIEQLR